MLATSGRSSTCSFSHVDARSQRGAHGKDAGSRFIVRLGESLVTVGAGFGGRPIEPSALRLGAIGPRLRCDERVVLGLGDRLNARWAFADLGGGAVERVGHALRWIVAVARD